MFIVVINITRSHRAQIDFRVLIYFPDFYSTLIGAVMLLAEAFWINSQIRGMNIESKSEICINIGSSTGKFMEQSQPYIKDLVLGPLSLKFSRVVNVDIKDEAGVDLVADFLTTEGRRAIQNLKPKVIMVSNLLEHLPDPLLGVQALCKLTAKNEILVLTGPRFYPYHPDPIDNRFRPTLKKIRRLMSSDFEILALEHVWGGTVLTANRYTVSTADLILWSKRQINFRNIIMNPKLVLRTVRNIFYPASAFCGVFRKL